MNTILELEAAFSVYLCAVRKGQRSRTLAIALMRKIRRQESENDASVRDATEALMRLDAQADAILAHETGSAPRHVRKVRTGYADFSPGVARRVL